MVAAAFDIADNMLINNKFLFYFVRGGGENLFGGSQFVRQNGCSRVEFVD